VGVLVCGLVWSELDPVGAQARSRDQLVDEIATLEGADADLEKRVRGLDRDIAERRRELAAIRERLAEAVAAAEAAERAVDRARDLLEAQADLVERRVVSAYIDPLGSGGPDVADPDDPNAAEEHAVLLGRVAAVDRVVLAERARAEARLERRRTAAERRRRASQERAREVAAATEKLARERAEGLEAQRDLRTRIDRFRAEVAALDAAGSTVERIISDRSGAGGPAFSGLAWPVRGTVTSEFGPRWGRIHQGIDIATASGTGIRAGAPGRVIYRGALGGYGNTVIIDHGHGWATLYGHQSRIAVRENEFVDRSTVIGFVGSTGNSTGPHLHLELRREGLPVDPRHHL
jgi:murein DD-endopeptidase MepM/ murein hydrolase activator NlpD